MPPNPPNNARRFAQYIQQAERIFLSNLSPPCLNMDLRQRVSKILFFLYIKNGNFWKK